MLFCQVDPPNKLYTHLSQALLFRLICHTPIKNRGLSINPWPFPTVLTIETSRKTVVAMSDYVIGHNTRPMVASSGFHWSSGTPPSGDAHGYVLAHRHGHQNGHLLMCICWLLFVCLLPWRPLGRYIANSRLMVASSGFWSSPGHAASGNAVCIAPAHRHGHQNGRRTRCICL
jgi:hypothetical protein